MNPICSLLAVGVRERNRIYRQLMSLETVDSILFWLEARDACVSDEGRARMQKHLDEQAYVLSAMGDQGDS